MFLSDHSVRISKKSSSSPRWLMMSLRIPLTQQSRTNMLTSDVPSNTADAIPQTSVQHAGAGRRAAEEVDATGFWEFKKKTWQAKRDNLGNFFFKQLCVLGRRVLIAQAIAGVNLKRGNDWRKNK